ncbi:MAG: ABC transporter substrate-binding protein [Anaerolineae bacterium]|nr:ABC transporter substrate-binding protein [Anaerolineae bacterium]
MNLNDAQKQQPQNNPPSQRRLLPWLVAIILIVILGLIIWQLQKEQIANIFGNTTVQTETSPAPVSHIAPIGESSPSETGVTDDAITIGISAAFDGPSQGLGIELYRGAQAYLTEVNENGGVHGRQINLRAYDDGYNPDPAIDNTISLIEDDHVFLLFNYVGTPTVTRILPLLKRYESDSIYLLFPFTGAQPQREAPYNEYVFNLRASYRDETAGLVKNFHTINRDHIAVLYQADAYGRSGWDGVKRALETYGLDIAAEATYARNSAFTDNYQEQIDILRAGDPDAIIIVGAYEPAAGFIRDARDNGWDIPIANLSFVGSENMLNLLLQAGEETGKDYTTNLINSQVVPSYTDTSLSAVNEYLELMDKHNPQFPNESVQENYSPQRYSFVSFEGFLNAKLLVEVLERIGENPKRADIDEAIEGIDFLDIGIDSLVNFDSSRQNSNQGLSTVYYTVVDEGQFVPLTSWEMWQQ